MMLRSGVFNISNIFSSRWDKSSINNISAQKSICHKQDGWRAWTSSISQALKHRQFVFICYPMSYPYFLAQNGELWRRRQTWSLWSNCRFLSNTLRKRERPIRQLFGSLLPTIKNVPSKEEILFHKLIKLLLMT